MIISSVQAAFLIMSEGMIKFIVIIILAILGLNKMKNKSIFAMQQSRSLGD